MRARVSCRRVMVPVVGGSMNYGLREMLCSRAYRRAMKLREQKRLAQMEEILGRRKDGAQIRPISPQKLAIQQQGVGR